MDTLDGYLSLIPKSEEDISLVASKLSEWNCCPRCVLRFLGEKDAFSYRKSNDELSKWLCGYSPNKSALASGDKSSTVLEDPVGNVENQTLEQEETNKDASSTTVKEEIVCVSCLGLLQETFCSEAFCRRLSDVLQKEDFEFDTYYISLSIPVPLMLREHAILIKLKELLPSVYDDSVKEDISQIKEVWKWANGFMMSGLLKVSFDQRSLFEIKVDFAHSELEKECSFLLDMYPEVFRKRKIIKPGCEVFTRVNVPNALEDMGDEKFKQNYMCPARPQSKPCEVEQITCTHEPVYVAGRYNKYSRSLSQTPWIVEGGRRTESSVEEMICSHLQETFRCREYKLSASGREDVDVLMLGRGRPFMVELINPHRIHFKQEEMTDLQHKINTSHSEIRVRDLQVVTKQDTSHLKKGEEEKVKIYSALCWINKPVTQDNLDTSLCGVKDLVIKQKTPIRVLHRRSLAARDRTIHTISARQKDNYHFTLSLSTQAGTYIKEFVHGDFGRTSPNLGHLLGGECDILELNVDAVELDWPKQLEDIELSE